MGLFKKKTKEEEKKIKKPEFEKFPELPKLPELPDFEEPERREPLARLPSFPNNSFGKKFSQETIKQAVTGEREEEEVPEADEFVSRREQMMRSLPEGKIRKPSAKPVPSTFKEAAKRVKEIEPLFIRIDKFEESLRAFEKAKEQIAEIEKMLRDTKRLKEEEERELGMWEKEIQTIKQQIEKIDQDIFSKIE